MKKLWVSFLFVFPIAAQAPTSIALPVSVEATIASASTIAPTSPAVLVTGTTPINTITPPTGCTTTGADCSIVLVVDPATGPFTLTSAGNIAEALSPLVGTAVALIYRPAASKWYPNGTIAGGSGSGSGGGLAVQFTSVPPSIEAALPITNITSGFTLSYGHIPNGLPPTITGCGTISAQAGGATAGVFTTSTAGTCSADFSSLPVAPNGWVCLVQDITKHVATNIMIQSGSTTNSCTVTGTTAASDVLTFTLQPY